MLIVNKKGELKEKVTFSDNDTDIRIFEVLEGNSNEEYTREVLIRWYLVNGKSDSHYAKAPKKWYKSINGLFYVLLSLMALASVAIVVLYFLAVIIKNLFF